MLKVLGRVPIADWWPVGAVFLVVGALVALVALRVVRRRWPRTLLVLLSVVTVLLSAAVGVNAHFGYVRTLGEALGGSPPGTTAPSKGPARAGARSGHGTVVPLTIPGTVSGFVARQAQVYLPPAWSVPQQAPLPVVMLLHGTPGDPTDWVEGGRAQTTADAWAKEHGGVAPV